jgi:hypothetical protein
MPLFLALLMMSILSANSYRAESLLYKDHDIFPDQSVLAAFHREGSISELSLLKVNNSGNQTEYHLANSCNIANIYSINGTNINNKMQTEGAGEVFTFSALPPLIVMSYIGKVYCGTLSDYKYRVGLTFNELQIPPNKVTMDLHSKLIRIQKDSNVTFSIKGFPKLLPPSNLGVGAYNASNGTSVKLLNSTNSDSTIVKMDLPRGVYVILAVGTWLPRTEDVTGYVIYKFIVDVI